LHDNAIDGRIRAAGITLTTRCVALAGQGRLVVELAQGSSPIVP